MKRSILLLLSVITLLLSCSSPTGNETRSALSDSNKVTPTADKDAPAANDQTLVAAPGATKALAADTGHAPKEEAAPDTNPLVGKHTFGVQFIWDQRGSATISQDWNELYIKGSQFSKDKSEYCELEGSITIISERKFTVDGTVKLFTKDCCGAIEKTGKFTFLKTGKRKFYRLQDFDQLCSANTCAYYLDIFD
jgi:hypothetical protein